MEPSHTPSDRPRQPRRSLETGQAGAISALIWSAVAAVFLFVVLPATEEPLTRAMLALVLVIPAALLSVFLFLAVLVGDLRREVIDLQRSQDELRRVISEHKQDSLPLSPVAQSRLDQLSAAQEQTDTTIAMFFSHRARNGQIAAEPAAAIPEDSQPRLALEDSPKPAAMPAGPAQLIRALHFPEDEHDTEGFEALQAALLDPMTAPLIRAAQDVLTRLAQDGIYMDDLRPERARPEFWRAFAQGTRGPLVSPLGGIRDRSCLALCSGRMRQDPEFRAAAHLFLREFDKVFAEFEKQADDAQIVAMTDTRSARAFMLLGRVSGVFAR